MDQAVVMTDFLLTFTASCVGDTDSSCSFGLIRFCKKRDSPKADCQSRRVSGWHEEESDVIQGMKKWKHKKRVSWRFCYYMTEMMSD
jgi:hypothetical protein